MNAERDEQGEHGAAIANGDGGAEVVATPREAEVSALTRLQSLSARLPVAPDLPAVLTEITDAAVALLGSDTGALHLYDADNGVLELVTHCGLAQAVVDRWRHVASDANGPRGKALQTRERVIIDNVWQDPRGEMEREVAQHAGYRGLEITPLITSAGWCLGTLCNHFSEIHRPAERDLRLLDLYLRQAADLIERMRAEQTLRQHDQRLSTAVGNDRLGSWELDLASGALSASDQCKVNFGFAASAAVSEADLCQAIHRDDRERVQASLRLALEQRRDYSEEFRCVWPDGNVRWLYSRGRILEAPDGTALRMNGVTLDVTYGKRSEELLMEQRSLLESIASGRALDECLSAICLGVSRLDTGARACFLLFDEERRSVDTSVAPDHDPSFAHALEALPLDDQPSDAISAVLCGGRAVVCPDIANDGEHTEDWRQLCLDHGVLACHVEPVIGAQGQPVAVFMLCFDQPRKADEWESRRAQFGAVVASVAIEREASQRALRASQQQLRRYQQNLSESQANLKKSQQRLQQLNKSLEQRVEERTVELQRTSARLRQLAKELTSAEIRERKRVATILHDELQQLLVSARIQLGRSHGRVTDEIALSAIEQAQSRLDEAVESSRDLTRELRPPVLYEDGLSSALQWLAEETERRHNMRVIVDGSHADAGFDDDLNALLFESVRELLFNASKYAGVDVAMLEVYQDDDHLTFQVRDTGVGFEPDPDYESASGSGFGLFSIRERITALGGEVSVQSQPGEGTTVELRVPKAVAGDEETPSGAGDEAEPSGEPAPVAEERAAAAAPATRHVVVVDDHAMVREGIASVLADDGRVTVTGEAGDGAEALDQLAQQQPDAVLVDVHMPHMNGVETTREIRRRWPQVVPIGLSVDNDASIDSRMREAGAADFIAKYGASEDLIGKILELTADGQGPPPTPS